MPSTYPRALPSAALKAEHRAIMDRAFPRRHHPVPRGTAPKYDAAFAARYGDENEALPGAEDELETPAGGFVFGVSLTCCPHEPDPFLVS